MRLALAMLLMVCFTAHAAEPAVLLTPEQARAKCNAQGEAAGNKAVAEAKLQHPSDAGVIKTRTKVNEFNRCMRLAGYASGPIRAK